VANKDNTTKLPKKNASKRGGARSGSGRPGVYSLLEKMALALRVAELQLANNCSRAEAIRKMQASGEIPTCNVSNIARYLTPKYLNPKIAAELKDAPSRIGIVAAIPMPTKIRTKK
jgi:hypothetical protein